MSSFTLALATFVALHIGVSATALRAAIVARIGERAYRGVFALASLAALIWMIVAVRAVMADLDDPLQTPVWTPPVWGRHATQGLVLIAFLFAASGLLTPGPTTAGFEGALAKETPARGVLRITRHPFLWGVAIWAGAHLLANGAAYQVMLFGSLGLMSLYGTRSIDRKSAARDPEGWARFAAATSNVPFAAILQGRNRLVFSELWLRLLAALALFALAAAVHGWLGRPVFP